MRNDTFKILVYLCADGEFYAELHDLRKPEGQRIDTIGPVAEVSIRLLQLVAEK